MARLGTVAVLGIVALVVGCGSSDKNGNALVATNSAGAAGSPTKTAGATSSDVSRAGGSSPTESAGGAAAISSGTQSIAGATSTGGNAGSLVGGAQSIAGATSTGGNAGSLVGGAQSMAGAAALGGGVNNAGGTGMTQVGGASGVASAGGSSGAGTCNYPECLTKLFSSCPAAPSTVSCTTQDITTTTTRQTNACYGDGSAAISVYNQSTSASTMTFKKGGATCYTMEVSVITSGAGVPTSTLTTLKNGTGIAVATEVWDVATNKTTVTCTGAQPVVLNAACDATSSGTYNCQPGLCNP